MAASEKWTWSAAGRPRGACEAAAGIHVTPAPPVFGRLICGAGGRAPAPLQGDLIHRTRLVPTCGVGRSARAHVRSSCSPRPRACAARTRTETGEACWRAPHLRPRQNKALQFVSRSAPHTRPLISPHCSPPPLLPSEVKWKWSEHARCSLQSTYSLPWREIWEGE